MRRKMQQIICWLHATLIFALIAPFLYALDFSEELRNTGLVYAKALLIVLPIAITGCQILQESVYISADKFAGSGRYDSDGLVSWWNRSTDAPCKNL